MNKKYFKIFSKYVVFIITLLLITTSFVEASDKKGVGIFDLNATNRIKALNVAWYYTWSSNPVKGITPEKFVPMLRSQRGHLQEQISNFRARGKIPILLAFNEPNMARADNISVEQVIQSWPEISNLAQVVGGPATAGAAGPWLDKFYRMAKTRNYKVDFMTIHFYPPPDAELFLRKIDHIYEKYHLPIWITEFAVADQSASEKNCKTLCENKYTEQDVLAFMKQVLPELEKRPYILRYAWFGAGNTEQVRTSALFDKDDNLTALGKFYAKFQ